MRFFLFVVCFLTLSFNAYSSLLFKTEVNGDVSYVASFSTNTKALILVANSKGVERRSLVGVGNRPNGAVSSKWLSKYNSITINQLSESLPTGGVNEMGLAVMKIDSEDMLLPINSMFLNLNEFETIQYLLDSFSSTQDAVDALRNIRIAPLLSSFHVFIADKSGESAVVEFIGGEFVVYDKKMPSYMPILSDVNYLKALNGVSSMDRLNSAMGCEYFSTVALRYKSSMGLSEVHNLLDEVKSVNTKINLVFNLKKGTIDFRNRDYFSYSTVSFDGLEFNQSLPMYIDLNALTPSDANGQFSPISENLSYMLMKSGLSKLNNDFFNDSMLNQLVYGGYSIKSKVMQSYYNSTGTLNIVINKLSNSKGEVVLRLYANEQQFEQKKPIQTLKVVVQDDKIKSAFYNLSKNSEYVVTYHHDENSNDKLDRMWVGFPKESSGSTGKNDRSFNNAKFVLSDFVKSEFVVDDNVFFL